MAHMATQGGSVVLFIWLSLAMPLNHMLSMRVTHAAQLEARQVLRGDVKELLPGPSVGSRSASSRPEEAYTALSCDVRTVTKDSVKRFVN